MTKRYMIFKSGVYDFANARTADSVEDAKRLIVKEYAREAFKKDLWGVEGVVPHEIINMAKNEPEELIDVDADFIFEEAQELLEKLYDTLNGEEGVAQ